MKVKGKMFLGNKFIFFLSFFQLLFLIKNEAQQEITSYPVQFSQYFFSYPVLNPGSLGAVAENELLLVYRRPITGFTGISTYFVNLSWMPYKPKRVINNKNIVGLHFYNDKEGAYINRSRFYGAYAFHTRVTKNLNFGGGIYFGGINYAVKSTPSTSGASAFAFDANSGVWFYNKKFHLGFSLNQLFNTSLRPYDEKTNFPIYMGISGSYRVISNEIIDITPHVLFTYPYFDNMYLNTSIYTLLFGRFIVAAGWGYNTEVSFMAGLKDIAFYNNKFNAVFSYCNSVKEGSFGIRTLELSLSYEFSPIKTRN